MLPSFLVPLILQFRETLIRLGPFYVKVRISLISISHVHTR